MQIISVVRDFNMYNQLIKDNPFYPIDTNFICFNNNDENLTIPIRYNSFLESYDYSNEDWFIFCHEDWELKENLEKRLNKLDKNSLYGVIGTSLNWNGHSDYTYGEIENSNKDGSNLIKIGNYNNELVEVGTFDCQCLIMHSSVVEKYGLRFDKKLTWDLYVEDFCIFARENHNIPSKILQLKCQHYSFGKITERFYKQYTYLQKKYKNAKSVIFVGYKGINVAQDTKLRRDFRNNNVEYKIYKNRLIVKALEQLGVTGYDPKLLEGTTSVVFAPDEVVGAKVLFENNKEFKILEAKFGIVNGEIVDSKKVEVLAKTPNKETLIAMLMGMLNAPVSALARALNEIAKKQAE